MRKHAQLLVVLSLAFAATGCATFPKHNLPVVTQADLASTAPAKTRVFSRWSMVSNSSLVNDQMKAAGAAIHKKYFDDAITRSGCCVLVEGPTEADVVVDGKALAENNPAAMIPAVITGLSLYTIPSWVTATTHIQVDAKKGDASKSYDVSDSLKMVQWLPMVFAMPFRDSVMKTGKSLDENVYNNLLLGMKKDGLIAQ